MTIKQCKKCGELKEHRARGLCNQCYNQLNYQENKEQRIENTRNWRKENPEKYKEGSKQWSKKWNAKNPERVRQLRKDWQDKNKERVNTLHRKYQNQCNCRLINKHEEEFKEDPNRLSKEFLMKITGAKCIK